MSAGDHLLIDTGFFIALFDERDQYHKLAQELSGLLDIFPIIVPWPVLYETINTRLTRRSEKLERFHNCIQSCQSVFLDDTRYRKKSYDAVIQGVRLGKKISLVDSILCSIIEDKSASLRAILSFNRKDFAEVCLLNGVEIVDGT